MVKKTKIQPLFDFVLVRPITTDAVTPSGIVLPDTVDKKSQVGVVMAIGPGGLNEKGDKTPMFVKVGMKVLYKKWGGNEVKVDREEWLLIEQKDVMAIVD